MSTTKTSVLSTTPAIFCGLQDDLKQSLTELPTSAPSGLKTSLVKAHHKLSDYYTKLDESPLYIWASRLFFHSYIFTFGLTVSSVLDPRIGYSGLLADCGDDESAKTHLLLAKNSLKTQYRENYLPSAILAI